MNVSFKDQKTGKWYNVSLAGSDKKLVLRLYTFLGLTGSLSTLTLMAYFAHATQGRPYSQEIFVGFAIVTILTGKRAYTLWGEVKKLLALLIVRHEHEHPHE